MDLDSRDTPSIGVSEDDAIARSTVKDINCLNRGHSEAFFQLLQMPPRASDCRQYGILSDHEHKPYNLMRSESPSGVIFNLSLQCMLIDVEISAECIFRT